MFSTFVGSVDNFGNINKFEKNKIQLLKVRLSQNGFMKSSIFQKMTQTI